MFMFSNESVLKCVKQLVEEVFNFSCMRKFKWLFDFLTLNNKIIRNKIHHRKCWNAQKINRENASHVKALNEIVTKFLYLFPAVSMWIISSLNSIDWISNKGNTRTK